MIKHLFFSLLISFILFSCESSNQINEIEILTYFTNARDFQIYSVTDKNGYNETLFKSQKSKEYIDNYQLKVRKSLMDSIIDLCKNSNEESLKFKAKKKTWYCGDWHNVQITYENGEKIRFNYPYADTENKQLIPFQLLSEQIVLDSLLGIQLSAEQLNKLYIKQKKLSNYIFINDSVEMRKYYEKHK